MASFFYFTFANFAKVDILIPALWLLSFNLIMQTSATVDISISTYGKLLLIHFCKFCKSDILIPALWLNSVFANFCKFLQTLNYS